jgi:FkbH-like protein
MYETEANHAIEPLDQLPADIQGKFQELTDRIQARTLLPWGEHCTECVWPTCYTTCELYAPREDTRCRRFVDGMVRVNHPRSPNSYLLKIRFKRWGKLWSPGNVRLYSPEEAARRERRDYLVGTGIFHFPLPTLVRKQVAGKRYYMKNALAQRRGRSEQSPTAFVIECYNPDDRVVRASLTMRPTSGRSKVPLQRLIELTPGFVRIRIPAHEIPQALLTEPFDVELTPNDIEDGTTLYFGVIDFIRETAAQEVSPAVPNAKKVKCVVWDLDNTLWNGTLVEDGAESLRLKAEIVGVIHELDRRGILQSVASKNNYQDVWPVVSAFGLNDYFLYPQVSWGPKSAAIEAIAKKLNIGLDTLLFIDDSPFELEQVRSACPDVRVVPASEAVRVPERADCNVPVTEEAASRRKLYQQDSLRQELAAEFDGDYLAFLRDCRLELTIRRLSPANLERVHELTQRTNQMNFSGNKYDRHVLEQLITAEHLDTYVLECRDRFGSYGIIGFSIVDRREPRMTDLMFSCRVQSKRIEHAFLTYLFKYYRSLTDAEFRADYRKTPRNAASGQVFADLGMEEVDIEDGVTRLALNKDRPILVDEIVNIELLDESSASREPDASDR